MSNSFSFPAVIFSRNPKHMKFRVRQIFDGNLLTDFRSSSFPGHPLTPKQCSFTLTALNALLGHLKSIKLYLSAYISSGLMSH